MKLKIGYALGLKRAICLFASTAALLSVNGQEYDWHSRPKNEAIHFEDPNVLAILIKHGVDTNGDRAISYAEAAAVTDVEDWFRQSVITKFDEFKYFTGVTDIGGIESDIESIEGHAFYCCRSLTSITIPNSVIEIGKSAFMLCEKLTSVTIPYSVTTIEDDAFLGCRSLTDIIIPDSVTFIGERAFAGCGFTGISIPYSVTSIGKGAFSYCHSLSSITIPYSWTYIEDKTFFECSSLKSIAIPDSVTSIGNSAFSHCSEIANITIPNSVITIGANAFSDCSSLTSITIPNSVTTIGAGAFSNCYRFTNITIPNSVISIGDGAFYGCRLERIYGKYATADNCCLIADGVLLAFTSSIGLTEYSIPYSVTSIGKGVFRGRCPTSIYIPNSVTKIGKEAFAGNNNLTSITIPDSVTLIGEFAFNSCRKLASIYCQPTTPPKMERYVFDLILPSAKIYVPMASVETYKAAAGWSKYADKIVGYDF